METSINNIIEHLFIIFGSDHYNTLGALRSVGEFGGKADLILHPKYSKTPHLVTNSKYSTESRIHIVNDVQEGFDLLIRCYSNIQPKPFLITCDDWCSCYVDEHLDLLKNKFYYFGGSKARAIGHYTNKYNASSLCHKYGINIPNIVVVQKGDINIDIEYPIITKSISSTVGGWKGDVYICHSKQDLLNAYKFIKSEQIMLSQFITKKYELNIAGFSINGGGQAYMPFKMISLRAPEGSYGHYIQIEPFDDIFLKNALKKVIVETSYSGIFSVDMLVDKDNKSYFLEINFRHSAFSYACNHGGINLIKEWALATINGYVDENMLNKKRLTHSYKAIAEANDLLQYVFSKKICIVKWFKDVLCADVHFYYNRTDKKPFFASIIHYIRNKHKDA